MTRVSMVLVVALAISTSMAVKEGETTFKLLSSRSGLNDPSTDIPEMEVTFGNGQKDTMVLRHYNAFPDSTTIDHARLCNYLGHLKYEEDARVAVTGCVDERNLEGKMYITLLSNRSPYQKSFSMDLDGNVEPINIMGSNDAYLEIPKDIITRQRDDDEDNDGDNIGSYKIEAEAAAAKTTGQKIPKELIIKMKIGVDLAAKKTIEGKKTTVVNWLAETFTHVQNHYYHPTLGYRMNFKIVGQPLIYDETLSVGTPTLLKLSKRTYDLNDDDIALYTWVVDGPGQKTGVAWRGGTCVRGSGKTRVESDGFSKTSLTSGPTRGIVETAETLAHEIGHNLGMAHDFYDNKKQCKREEDGKKIACTGCKNWASGQTGLGWGMLNKVTNWDNPGKSKNPGECCTGFMDYNDHPEYWSDCSVRDFEHYYVAEKWAKCLPAGGATGKAWDPKLSTSICLDSPSAVGNCKLIAGGNVGDCKSGPNKDYFFANCKKTCGLCPKKPTAPPAPPAPTAPPAPPASTAPPAPPATTAPPAPPAPTAPPATGCKDKWTGCKPAYCSWGANYCKKTCNTCGVCGDEWTFCKPAYCSWGSKYCKKTCNKCAA